MKSNQKILLEYLKYIENKNPKQACSHAILKSTYNYLGFTQLQSFIITVTGTNGKGSTVGLLEDIFIAQGFTVGSNTSPHLIKYNERIKYNGHPVSDEKIIMAFNLIEEAYGANNSLCYTHYAFLAALIMFVKLKPDIIILEVGLGGRLDAANTVDADISVITSIDLDHIELLGDTREKIGLEKCVIARSNRPLIISDPDVPDSVIDYCQANNVDMKSIQNNFKYEQEGKEFTYIGYGGKQYFNLMDNVHPHSVACVLGVMDEMPEQFVFSFDITQKIIESFFILGRKQVIQVEPNTIIVDVGHNLQAIKSLFEFVLKQVKPNGRLNVIYSSMGNKDISGIIDYVSQKINHWYLVPLNQIVDRGVTLGQLKLYFENKLNVTYYQSIDESYQDAKNKLGKDDCLVIFGSFVLVGEILNLVNG